MSEDYAPAAWIGCLACHNAGNLVGEWFDADALAEVADLPEGDMRKRVGCTHADHEEFWVMDYEGFAGALEGECSPMEAAALAEWLGRMADAARGWGDILPALVEYARETFAYGDTPLTEVDPDDVVERLIGVYDNDADMAEEYLSDAYDADSLPEWVRYHVDWAGIAHDMRCGGEVTDYQAPDGRVYFRTF